jgi:hypothetical protein
MSRSHKSRDDPRSGSKKYLVNPIRNRILFEIGDLKEPLRLLKDLLEQNIEFQLFAYYSARMIPFYSRIMWETTSRHKKETSPL